MQNGFEDGKTSRKAAAFPGRRPFDPVEGWTFAAADGTETGKSAVREPSDHPLGGRVGRKPAKPRLGHTVRGPWGEGGFAGFSFAIGGGPLGAFAAGSITRNMRWVWPIASG
ncbi:hypothetical protein TR75_12335 [Hydrogenibacillus schlegelii]|uniref:Uncharacterized protein n=1 Tax=Hydrogenibacillus schlegelii TaxID=1484 RepID=A0A132MH75_HYDSH|nr:hypothetical protein TR75_12335 [Hydrogenibacillus schlegelii]OAR05405.1 hypothetical protein SA87_10920 [Hydrogenibacillus schlegelii]